MPADGARRGGRGAGAAAPAARPPAALALGLLLLLLAAALPEGGCVPAESSNTPHRKRSGLGGALACMAELLSGITGRGRHAEAPSTSLLPPVPAPAPQQPAPTPAELEALAAKAAELVPRRPAADRGTYVDFLVFVDDEDNLPTHFKDDHFNPVVVVPQAHVVQDLNAELARHRAQFIVSIGDAPRFAFLETLPAQVRLTWFHLDRPGDLQKQAVETFFWKAIRHANAGGTPNEPLMSVFTPAYKSEELILLPYESLRNQTYQNWEWVIYDDSPADHGETWLQLQALAARDYRVRVFRSDRNDGYIGSVKRKACLEAIGVLLVELDHDDILTPDALQLLREAYLEYPEAGYFFTDSVRQYEGKDKYMEYGDFWAYGNAAHYKLLLNGTWATSATCPLPNQRTLRHIIGIPNHIRAWSRDAYLKLGGHTKGLPVADDYDLTVRAQLAYPSVYLRHTAYVQYRREDGGTFTFKRNALIQRMTHVTSHGLDPDIVEALKRAGHPDGGFEALKNSTPFHTEWEPPPPRTVLEYHRPTAQSPPGRPRVTVVVATYNNTEGLDLALGSVFAQDYDNWELVIVGDSCPELDAYMEQRKDFFKSAGKEVRWYNMKRHHGGRGWAAFNYGLKALVATDWVAMMQDKDSEWRPSHLSSLVALVAADPKISYALSSISAGNRTLLCDEPRLWRVSTHTVLFRRALLDQYGALRSSNDVGAANDWELVSRWRDEPWAASLKPTAVIHGISDAFLKRMANAYCTTWLCDQS